ncbi:heat shock 70 kDa protein 14-like [Lingula anatina]|uniref:Heat shock 70 kDa protein 14-like n=1 Tax=Lingula anatina TaxID=7574 RepID=A0A1S3IAN9_LINAN|nr:heat shock 70 kDa protein 14-like [Lingula anatina]|eukprot:XP_013395327.1 heat shock 70 kDa protein 14-like [Lingula anatina]
MPTAQCSVESLHEGIDFQSSVSRARFESLVSSLLQQCLQPVEQVLTEAQLTKENINKVIVCGGTTKIPALQRSLKDYFNEAEFLNSIVPDEVVALGAAKQAAILTGNEEESKLHEQENEVECLSKQILIKVLPSNSDQDKPQVLFPAFTPIPVRRQHIFNLSPEQTTFCMEIFEADDSINDTVLLGKVVMQEVPENGQITAVFHIRREGSLHVTCTEKTSGKLEDVLIEAQ